MLDASHDYSEGEHQRRKQQLPGWLQNNLQTKCVIIFETFGSFLFCYGICCSQYLLPTDTRIPNPFHNVFISCSLFVAICWSGIFTGGHVNPTITTAEMVKGEGLPFRQGMVYIASQVAGAMIGAFAAWSFFDEDSAPYYKTGVPFVNLVVDCLSQVFASFLFSFFVLVITTKDTTFIHDTYWKFLFIPILLYICRTFSFRIGCLNPAIGLAIEVVQAIVNSEPILVAYSLTMIIGPLTGGALGAVFFNKFFRPVYNKWKEESGANEE